KAPRQEERIAIDDPGANSARSRGSAPGARPRLLVSMIEEDGRRPGWTTSQPAALEGNDASKLELDRRSPIIGSPKMLISARESVSLHGSTEISSSDRAQDRDWSARTQPSANLPGGNVSSFSHLPKDESGGWRENPAPGTESNAQRVDG